MKDGKPEWGEKHLACHAYLVQAGGKKLTRGLQKGQTVTRQANSRSYWREPLPCSSVKRRLKHG